MKILQFINSLYAGGAEKLLVDAAIAYRDIGLNVDILLLNDTSSPFKQILKKCPDLTVHSIGQNINIYNPLLIFRLNKYFEEYDIIHVHLFPSIYWAGLSKFFKLTKKPLIITEHSTNNNRRDKPIMRMLDRFIYRQFEHIVTISDAAKESLIEHLGQSFKNIRTVENGVDLKAIHEAKPYSKTDLGLSEDSFVLIQVSSFRYPKDQATVIKALKILPDHTHLILVGDGPLRDENEKLAKQLGVSERVHLLGIRNDVPRLLKSADVAILSSIYEGLSLSSVEGMASGRPFIATDVPGLTEVVKDAGILVPAKNETKMAEEIIELIKDEAHYKRIVEKCLMRANNYDIRSMVEKYAKLFEAIQNSN